MTKPPASTPHSDIDGVHRDEKRNTEVASDLGQGSEELKKAHEQDQARPPYTEGGPKGSPGA